MQSTNYTLASLKFPTRSDYDANLADLVSMIEKTPENTIVVAPEVCLTGFDYQHFEEAAAFAPAAVEALLPVSQKRVIILTVVECRETGIYNVAKVLHNGSVIHEQAKSRLFKLGDEHSYFAEGREDDIVMFQVDGVRIGILICFELRFKTLWQKLEGCDIIAVPAQWGKLRAANYVTLTEALAVMNQCYVIASDTDNEDTTGESGIVTPFGEAVRNGNRACLSIPYDKREVRKMRRYLDTGIAQ
jgi:predicted amidohydrolase